MCVMDTKIVDSEGRVAADPAVVTALLLDGTQTARVLNVSRTHVYKLIQRGVIKPYSIGGLTVFWAPEVHAAAAARRGWGGE